jgi:hypothetical protein
VAAGDPRVASHAWLEQATEYCIGVIDRLDRNPAAMELAFTVRLFDAAHEANPRAEEALSKLAEHVPPTGLLPVTGGIEGETMKPLDFAPRPGGPARELFSAEVISADLERLAGAQEDDGGWTVDYASYSPAAALEWRGHATVRAVTTLKANGEL